MRLFDLPDELLCRVLQACCLLTDERGRLGPKSDGRQAILSFSCTCHRAFDIAHPFLLQSFLIRTQGQVPRFVDSLSVDGGWKSKHIREIALAPNASEDGSGYTDFAKALHDVSLLERLFIETPHHYAYTDVWEVLQKAIAELGVDEPGLGGYSIPKWSHHLVTCKNHKFLLDASIIP